MELYRIIHIWKLKSLQWRQNGRGGVSNHRRRDSLLNRLFMRRSNKTSKLRVTDLCEGDPPVTGENKFHPTFYRACDYLSMPGLKLIETLRDLVVTKFTA